MKKYIFLINLTYLMLLASCGEEIEAEDIVKKDKVIDYEVVSAIVFDSGVIYDLKEIVYKDGTVKTFFKVGDKVMFDQEYLNTKLPQFPKELSEMMRIIDEYEEAGKDEDAHSVVTNKYKIGMWNYGITSGGKGF